MKLILHQAKSEEANDLLGLYLEFFKSTGMEAVFCKPEQRHDVIAWIQKYINEHKVWVWSLDGCPVALAQVVPCKNELFAIVVNYENRNSGIGKTIIGDLKSQYSSLNTKPVTKAAKVLFSRCGFQPLKSNQSVWEWKS